MMLLLKILHHFQCAQVHVVIVTVVVFEEAFLPLFVHQVLEQEHWEEAEEGLMMKTVVARERVLMVAAVVLVKS